MALKLLMLLMTLRNIFSYAQEYSQVVWADSASDTPLSEPWATKYGAQIDQPFSGPLSFSHLPYTRCLDEAGRALDLAILGLPFDTAVSYRSGARFGPHAIRAGSRRQRATRGWTLGWGVNPYVLGLDIIDCGTQHINKL